MTARTAGSSRLTAVLVAAATAGSFVLTAGCTAGQDGTPTPTGTQSPATAEAPSTGPDTEPATTAPAAEVDDPHLRSLLLSAAELSGGGYSPTTELDGTGVDLLANCPALDGSSEPAAQARIAFITQAGATLGESLQRMATVDDARAVMAELAGVPEACGTFSAELAGKPELAGVAMQVTVTAADDPPPVGDERVGLRITVSLGQPLVEQYQYAVRSGDLIIMVFHAVPLGTADAELTGTVTETAYRKVTGG
ncbi:hypothetical protein ACN27F_30175 [Solwaraspora sp. WMMB335]|uniref:hypothetical protein n=1 Tax=Solwaraspora sp. WMMB335 TaxID=3404118 RepID=UPI003B92402C